MPPRGNQPQERVCEANWRRSLCAAKRDPRLRGCTPLRTPIRKSEGAGAKRKQYYFSFLTPPPLPPPLSREFPRTPAGGGEGGPPCQRGLAALADWGISTGLASPPAHCKGAGCRPPLPLSFATHSQQSVGAGHARPATLLCPRQRAEPFRPASRPPPLKGEASLAGFARAKGSSRSGVTPRCAGRCREATEGFGSEGLAEPTRPEGL